MDGTPRRQFLLPLTTAESTDLHKEALAESFSGRAEIDLSKSEERKLWWIHFYHIILFLFFFVIVWHVATRMLFIYFEFKGVIDYIDENIRARASQDAQTQLKYYNFSSGYSIAYYYVYPNMPTNPFLNNSFPASIIYSYYTPQYQAAFTKSYENVQAMFVYASMGSFCADKPDTGMGVGCMRAPDPNEIICNTYGAAWAPCSAVCIKSTTMSAGEWASSVGGGAMMGGVVGGGPGIVIGATAQATVNLLSDQENENVVAAEQNCAAAS